jgi:DNA-binding transcriptional LysR family regulator
MLDLRLVAALREVAARGSFSAAAQALRYTQPAVSRQVAMLERQAGMPLVVRSRKGVHLTAAGRLVLDHAEAVHARLLRLDAELAELAGGSRIAVALGGFPTAFVGLVPAIVRAVLARAPEAAIALRRCGHDEAIAAVRRAELDLALIFARTGVSPPGDVTVVDLADEPMLALLPRDHPAARRRHVSLAALAAEAWIVGAPDPASSVIVSACREAGFEPRLVFETDDALAIQSLVAAGLGVSLTTPWLAAALRPDVVLRPLASPAPVRRIQAVLAEPAGPGGRLLLELAREAVAERPHPAARPSAAAGRGGTRGRSHA